RQVDPDPAVRLLRHDLAGEAADHAAHATTELADLREAVSCDPHDLALRHRPRRGNRVVDDVVTPRERSRYGFPARPRPAACRAFFTRGVESPAASRP